MALGNGGTEKEKRTLGIVPDEGKIDNTEDVARILKAQRHYKITIPSTETDRAPVEVSVNGYTYVIKRDEQVEAPEAVVEVLRNAKPIQYVPKRRDDGEGNEMVPVVSQRHAFQVG